LAAVAAEVQKLAREQIFAGLTGNVNLIGNV